MKIQIGKKIKREVIVDKDDYCLLSKHKWYAKQSHRCIYACARINGRFTGMHRVVLGVTDPKIQIDHINRNGLDNRKRNLRITANAENQVNSERRSSNKSGFKGVHWDKKENRWRATIGYGGARKRLGSFKDIRLAAAAYNGAARALYGKYAYLNVLGEKAEVDKIMEGGE